MFIMIEESISNCNVHTNLLVTLLRYRFKTSSLGEGLRLSISEGPDVRRCYLSPDHILSSKVLKDN